MAIRRVWVLETSDSIWDQINGTAKMTIAGEPVIAMPYHKISYSLVFICRIPDS